MSAGHRFTVPTALYLISELKGKPFQVIFDHGSADQSSQIVSWFGPAYIPPLRPKQLAQLDIAVIHPQTRRAITLIEIEDSSNNPKTLLSDLFALLLGSGITTKRQQAIHVGPWTSFVVFAKYPTHELETHHADRIKFINDQIVHIKKHLQTPNAVVGQITLDTFVGQEDLRQKTMSRVNHTIGEFDKNYL